MKRKHLVSSFEQSRILNSLGISQSSLFHWKIRPDNSSHLRKGSPIVDTDVAAFTVSELGEMLGENAAATKKYHPGGWVNAVYSTLR